MKFPKPSKKTAHVLVLMLLALGVFFSCRDDKKLTPVQVLEKARLAFSQKQPKEFLRHLSKEATQRMESLLAQMRKSFSSLPKRSLEGLAEKMGLTPANLTHMTLVEYLQYQMGHETLGMGSDNLIFPVKEIDPSEIKETKESGDNVTFIFENGSELHFIKEDDAWKIHSYKTMN